MESLEFSKKYHCSKHAENYFSKHTSGFWRSLSNRFEQNIVRNALLQAGNPDSVLDIPCGAGRFWNLLAENKSRKLIAMDNSQHMINVALEKQHQTHPARIETHKASAFEIPLPDNAVESIFCIRLMHHIGQHEDRLALLQEFLRVTSDSVIVSLWIDGAHGNFQAWRRKRKNAHRMSHRYHNRFLIPAAVFESEISESGLVIEKSFDLLPCISMWRTYVLRKQQ